LCGVAARPYVLAFFAKAARSFGAKVSHPSTPARRARRRVQRLTRRKRARTDQLSVVVWQVVQETRDVCNTNTSVIARSERAWLRGRPPRLAGESRKMARRLRHLWHRGKEQPCCTTGSRPGCAAAFAPFAARASGYWIWYIFALEASLDSERWQLSRKLSAPAAYTLKEHAIAHRFRNKLLGLSTIPACSCACRQANAAKTQQ